VKALKTGLRAEDYLFLIPFLCVGLGAFMILRKEREVGAWGGEGEGVVRRFHGRDVIAGGGEGKCIMKEENGAV